MEYDDTMCFWLGYTLHLSNDYIFNYVLMKYKTSLNEHLISSDYKKIFAESYGTNWKWILYYNQLTVNAATVTNKAERSTLQPGAGTFSISQALKENNIFLQAQQSRAKISSCSQMSQCTLSSNSSVGSQLSKKIMTEPQKGLRTLVP